MQVIKAIQLIQQDKTRKHGDLDEDKGERMVHDEELNKL